MPNTHSDFTDPSERPTEELYIELRDLEATAVNACNDSDVPPTVADEDPSGIRERIAYLRALLSDRGVIDD